MINVNINFSKKIFLAIFLSCLIICTVVIWITNYFVARHEINTFVQRYKVFSKVIGNTLVQLEQNTESLMFNAAKVVVNEDREKGLLSTDRLKRLASHLNITHVFITDSRGNFIRSTNEDPSLIPNLFSFCDDYKNLIIGTSNVEKTPIIPPEPEPNPYKFLTLPNYNRTRLIEVGVKAEFIGKTLTDALSDDSNVLELDLFAPDGMSLGSYGQHKRKYQRIKADLSGALERGIIEEKYYFNIFTRVDSSQTNCCQCNNAGLSKNGEYYYILKSKISKRELLSSLIMFKYIFIGLQVVVFVLSLLLSRWLSRKLVGKIDIVNKRVKNILSAKTLKLRVDLKGTDEIAVLSQNFDRLLETLEQAQEKLVNSQRQYVMMQTARQVAHDIKSPLVALKSAINKLSQLPEDQRIMIREATQRIEDIANTLSSKKHEEESEDANSKKQLSNCLLSSLISLLITEKRLQYRSRIGITIEANLDESSYGHFARIQPVEFRRVISNLIDNSIDAVGKKGNVLVNLYAKQQTFAGNASVKEGIILEVSDNGKGIPKDILPKLMIRGFSYGKEKHKKSGLGLGLYHARSSVKAWGGDIRIESEIDRGTKVIITLPKEPAPDWFVPEIKVKENLHVIALDDDTSIHHIWQNRFDLPYFDKRNLVHLTTPAEVIDWHQANKDHFQDCLYLFDYELLEYEMTGLDVIEKLGISKQSILVTSRFEDKNVRKGCAKLGVKLLPKNLASFVPIIRKEQYAKGNDSIIAGSTKSKVSEKYDAVLIDDDILIHTCWKMSGKKIAFFKSPSDFFSKVHGIDFDTNIYIDSNLSNGVKGEDVAKQIYSLGFKNIYIETGFDSSEFDEMPWIKGVIGKEPPWR